MTNEYRDQYELALEQARDRMNADRINALYSQAKRCVIDLQVARVSHLQRMFRVGYGEALNVISRLVEEGVVSKADPRTGERKVLIQPALHVQGALNNE